LLGKDGVKGTCPCIHLLLERVELGLELPKGRVGGLRGSGRIGEPIAVEDVKQRGCRVGDRVGHTEPGLESSKRIIEEARSLGPVFEDDAIGISFKGEAAGGNNVAIFGFDVAVNKGRSSHNVLKSENGNLEGINGLNVTGDGRVEGLVVNDRGCFEETVNGSTVKEVKSHTVHRFTDERALEGASPSVEVCTEFRVQGLSEGERVDLEVNSTGAVSPFTDLPVSL
jgi:hypothetical protein